MRPFSLDPERHRDAVRGLAWVGLSYYLAAVMIRLILALALVLPVASAALAGPAAEVAGSPPGPSTPAAEPPMDPANAQANPAAAPADLPPPRAVAVAPGKPSGFWGSGRPAVGGAYRYRLLGIGVVVLLLTLATLLWILRRNRHGAA